MRTKFARVRPFTEKERRVAQLVSEGCNSNDIARELGIPRQSVRNCRASLYLKCDILRGDTAWQGHFRQQILLGFYWSCELFQIGLRELGYHSTPPRTLQTRLRKRKRKLRAAFSVCDACLEGRHYACQDAECPCVHKQSSDPSLHFELFQIGLKELNLA
jgi:DNA-binding CsgD family transcriptional regulator